MKITFSKVIWFAFYFFLFVFFLFNSFSYLDPDLGWHLRVGQEIRETGAVPQVNHYNYTIEGRTWVDHEWLLDAFASWIYDSWGYIALSIFFALLLTAMLAGWHYFIQKKILKDRWGDLFFIVFILWGAFAIRPHVGVRMQEVTLLSLALLLVIIYYYNKNKNIKPLLFLPPLFYLWTCVHGGFLIGIFLLFFFIGVKLVELFMYRWFRWNFIDFKKLLSFRYIAVFTGFSLLSVAVTFFTPYGIKLYSFLGGYTNTFYMTHISEWLGQHYFPLYYWQLVYLSTTGAILFLIIFLSFSRKNKTFKIDLWQVGLFLLFLVLAFKSRRHFPLFFLVSLPTVVYFCVKFFDVKKKMFRFDLISSRFSWLIKAYLILCFTVAIASVATATKFTNKPFQNYCGTYPCGAVQFLKDNPEYDDQNIFNKYSWGGYLVWAYPERKIFIDGRLPQYEFAGHTMLEEYYEFFEKDKPEEKLREHDIGLVLMESDRSPLMLDWFEGYFLRMDPEEVKKEDNYLKEYLKESPDWDRVYKSDVSVIYTRVN